MKMRTAVLSLLALGLFTLQGCSRGGTWFPKDSASVRRQTYWDRRPRPAHLIHNGINPLADEDIGSVSKDQRK